MKRGVYVEHVAMSAGGGVMRELYVGFLLFLLSFLYLSHLNELATKELNRAQTTQGQPLRGLHKG